jgi:tRNA(His) 5'-end guanylyltransferase
MKEKNMEKQELRSDLIRPPFSSKPGLEGIYIFAAPNEKTENVKAFDICNGWARLLYKSVVEALNDTYPEDLKNKLGLKKLVSGIQDFLVDGDFILANLKDGTSLKILRARGFGMLTGHGVGGFGLSPEEAKEIQDGVLGLACSRLNRILDIFKVQNSLKTRMNDLRAQTDSIKLDPDQYVLIMCDGHCFSKEIKNKFKLPFDDTFIRYMNNAAIEAAKKIQGFVLAYTQSDEISFLLHRREGSPFSNYRLNKMVSLVASWVSTAFMAQIYKDIAKTPASSEDIAEMIDRVEPLVFDGRAFNLPTDNDAFAWFLWRQNDCVRNSKQQAAQTYFSHSRLKKLNTDQQIELLLKEKGIDWNDYEDGKKYGRLIYKENIKKFTEDGEEYIRTIWPVHEIQGKFGDDLRKMINPTWQETKKGL